VSIKHFLKDFLVHCLEEQRTIHFCFLILYTFWKVLEIIESLKKLAKLNSFGEVKALLLNGSTSEISEKEDGNVVKMSKLNYVAANLLKGKRWTLVWRFSAKRQWMHWNFTLICKMI